MVLPKPTLTQPHLVSASRSHVLTSLQTCTCKAGCPLKLCSLRLPAPVSKASMYFITAVHKLSWLQLLPCGSFPECTHPAMAGRCRMHNKADYLSGYRPDIPTPSHQRPLRVLRPHKKIKMVTILWTSSGSRLLLEVCKTPPAVLSLSSVTSASCPR